MHMIETNPSFKQFDIQNQIKDMDFNSYNPIKNVGGLSIILCLLFVEFVGVFLLKALVSYLKKIRN